MPCKRIFGSLCLLLTSVALPQASPNTAWPVYGGNAGGQRYSAANQITPANAAQLHPAWEYHTRALLTRSAGRTEAAFEATPILFNRDLYFTTPFDQVIALDAVSGAEKWRYDPVIPTDFQAGVYTSRGVASWSGRAKTVMDAPCTQRIFVATLDGRLIALDAATGTKCSSFGEAGTVDLKKNLPTQTVEPYKGYGVTSPPTVVGDTVIVGSAVADGQEVDVEPGIVRGFDARSGQLRWTWDPMPWATHQPVRTGGGNTWGTISADPVHGLVYLPTGSPSPDFYGGLRPGDDKDADSVVALNAQPAKRFGPSSSSTIISGTTTLQPSPSCSSTKAASQPLPLRPRWA